MSMVTILSHSFFFSSCGTVLVTTRCFSWLLLILLIASPLRIPCVTIAMADVAPFSMTTSAALHRVPQVSAMSSTMIAVRPFTLPTKTIRLTSFGRARSLWMSANSVLRLSAIAVALNGPLARNLTRAWICLTSSLLQHRVRRSRSPWQTDSHGSI